ncbi:MAG: type II secretion system protein [Phycisphaeraceae bacterium]
MFRSRRGFTLVEMLVVLAIIAVLVALLMPAVMSAVNNARRAAIGVELAQLDTAMQSYKTDKGDFPPNLRSYEVFIRHVRKCYPKIDAAHLNRVIQTIWNDTAYSMISPPPATAVPLLDEGESLVFWLYLIDQDPRQPFKAADPTHVPTGTAAEALLAATSAKRYFPFKEDRFVSEDSDQFPAYRALYSKSTCYIHIDSRSYFYFYEMDYTDPAYAAYADGNYGDGYFVRPYWSEDVANVTTGALKAKNPTTFQIICAGQDGEFGAAPPTMGAKRFPSGGITNATYVPATGAGYMPGDRDNLTNFTEGRRLEDHIP